MHRKLLLLLGLVPFATIAQTNETVILGPQYADQVWVDLETGIQTTRSVNEWDLAFQIHGWTASVRVNTQKAGVLCYRSPFAMSEWNTVDTAGVNTWTQIHDGDESWTKGALNSGVTSDSLDLGWGNYNFITHVVVGDSIFVMQLANGDWKKLRIDDLAGGYYHFTYANLDGTDEVSGEINTLDHATKNFVYWSIENDVEIDREPASIDWDLTFTRYIGNVPPLGAYGVTGVLSNSTATVGKVAGMPVANAQWSDATMEGRMNVIGFDWKEFDMNTFLWNIHDSLSYFVQTEEGNVWKLYFTGFGGSQAGDIQYTLEQVSVVGVEEIAVNELTIFPNPSTNGSLNVKIPEGMTNAAIVVRDMAGRVVSTQSISRSGQLVQVHLVDLTDGMYLVEVSDNTTRSIARVIIER